MKDEIKEILDKINCSLKMYERDKKFNQISPESICFLNPKEQQILLDYITNLQEIVEEHKNCTRKHWQQKCAEHYANEMIYKSRNEKAIEFVKEHQRKDEFLNLNEWQTKDLLNILGGDDND